MPSASNGDNRPPLAGNLKVDLERDELWFDRRPALAFCLRMIFSENRFPLFGSRSSLAPADDLVRFFR
jgi:hypothetical protein